MRRIILAALASMMAVGAAQAGTLVIDNKTWGVTLRSYPSEHLGEFREHSAEAGQWLRYFSKDEPDRPVDGVDSISVKPFALLGYEWLNFDVPKGKYIKKLPIMVVYLEYGPQQITVIASVSKAQTQVIH